jgi:SagB-type dehydrogenase family enzyme
MTPRLPTAEFSSLVYGPGGVAVDDPAEAFHEASSLYPNIAPDRLSVLLELARRPELHETLVRASRLQPNRPGIDLPRRSLPRTGLRDLLVRRESGLGSRRVLLGLRDLGVVLAASYGAVERRPGLLRRPVPSGGALYPLELYVVPLEVEGLDDAAYHYDPFHHRLERLSARPEKDVSAAVVDPALVDAASAFVVVTAMFWRSRFKYGLRAYRFALLEAGHTIQNAVLAATALGVPALPLGGFYDRRVDALVGADGLAEAAVYALLLGGRA